MAVFEFCEPDFLFLERLRRGSPICIRGSRADAVQTLDINDEMSNHRENLWPKIGNGQNAVRAHTSVKKVKSAVGI
jgi:hypothetical protein